jgi:hypothetical protein
VSLPGERINVSRISVYLLMLASVVLFAEPYLSPAGEHPDLDSKVKSIIHQVCDTLEEEGVFTFHAHITYDEVLESGTRLRYSGELQSALRRPDGLRTDFRGDLDSSSAWYDGHTFTLFDPATGLYATTQAPGQIDTLLVMVHDSLGFSLPLADLYFSTPCLGFTANLEKGSYRGVESVGEARAHRLDMSQQDIDWQIWIEEGDRPLPRKMTITYKRLPGSPQFTAVISDWDFSPMLSEDFFTFRPPDGSSRIEFLPERAGSDPSGAER